MKHTFDRRHSTSVRSARECLRQVSEPPLHWNSFPAPQPHRFRVERGRLPGRLTPVWASLLRHCQDRSGPSGKVQVKFHVGNNNRSNRARVCHSIRLIKLSLYNSHSLTILPLKSTRNSRGNKKRFAAREAFTEFKFEQAVLTCCQNP